jgi:uncharacterized membrane protein
MDPKKPAPKTLSEQITEFIGTPLSIFLHTVFFLIMFVLVLFGWPLNEMLLVLTTIVSIEAIYLALFIQMTVNKTTESLEDVEEDIEEIQEDDIEDEQKDEELSKSLQTIQTKIGELQKDLEHLKKKV